MTWSDVNSSKLSPEQRYVSGGEGRTRTQTKTVAREPILDLVMFKRRVLSSIFHHNFYSDDLKTTVEKLKREERELQRQYLNTLDLENKIQQELKDK